MSQLPTEVNINKRNSPPQAVEYLFACKNLFRDIKVDDLE